MTWEKMPFKLIPFIAAFFLLFAGPVRAWESYGVKDIMQNKAYEKFNFPKRVIGFEENDVTDNRQTVRSALESGKYSGDFGMSWDARLYASGGVVAVRKSGEPSWLRFKEGNELYLLSGDEAATAENGEADIILYDKAVIKLFPGTEIEFADLHKPGTLFRLKKGTALVRLKNLIGDFASFTFEAGGAEISARKGLFIISYNDKAGKAGIAELGEGRVYVIQHAAAAAVELNEGEETVFGTVPDKNGFFSPPETRPLKIFAYDAAELSYFGKAGRQCEILAGDIELPAALKLCAASGRAAECKAERKEEIIKNLKKCSDDRFLSKDIVNYSDYLDTLIRSEEAYRLYISEQRESCPGEYERGTQYAESAMKRCVSGKNGKNKTCRLSYDKSVAAAKKKFAACEKESEQAYFGALAKNGMPEVYKSYYKNILTAAEYCDRKIEKEAYYCSDFKKISDCRANCVEQRKESVDRIFQKKTKIGLWENINGNIAYVSEIADCIRYVPYASAEDNAVAAAVCRYGSWRKLNPEEISKQREEINSAVPSFSKSLGDALLRVQGQY